ncbi:hypothetical protein MNEG_12324 [Monoraphidium neglectum]|uniref:Ubiquitin-like domain-containing protein n=1 Tax=Monoraphidium neglectum TaxID=145388 RepID=A0A0D2J791_9CHLO|nr:hypothetical protein MNEG_12324 [Monoraphidium neglectum]KIY95637.1 hypothetical protein MNEG_12324 [Monoraphidium neglectum]|eukprot:XP_013894657.1 hypothetical protein MNEG_12324 [Monoraphidium neglectum]
MQLFVRVPGQPTVAVEIGSDATMAVLKQAIEDRTGIPAAEQLLTRGGRALPASLSALPYGAALDLLLRLAGGKGGFGALLRGQGRDGKITDNFDACRDLQGRRVRQVEAEKKLKEWAAQSKERELEKIAQQHIRDLARQQRQERDYEINVEAVRNEQRAALERVQEAVQSALAEGLATGAPGGSSGSGSGASGSGGGSSDTEAGGVEAEGGAPGSAGAKRKAPDAAAAAAFGEGAEAAAAAAKRPRKGMLDMLDGSEDGDSSSDEEDE